ncbi:Crp/Fnr family transcriptional regulator [Methylomonas rhizoryzae]|uniref:Crp/Fnr family transcriptional regulator n=1 Tax=Methylomonas rhizoryzae TaxID=2608981 RepID=UPI0018D83743|nr:Crp/Fnr family transcriptional regulator [Methylomonas rhizoryzae]
MPIILTIHAGNQLLDALPAKDRDNVLAHCEPVNLGFAKILYLQGDPIRHLYFPTTSFIAAVTPVHQNNGLEAGLIGNEGVLGITRMLEVEIAPYQALVQGAGSALRIPAPLFLEELGRSPALQMRLKRYLYVSIMHLAQTAACNRYHPLEPRLARWLLMTHDRAQADTFHVTHIFLAYILGVRRVGITKAAHSLQEQNLISYRRGNITILDRSGLEHAACGCYRAASQNYDRFMGS